MSSSSCLSIASLYILFLVISGDFPSAVGTLLPGTKVVGTLLPGTKAAARAINRGRRNVEAMEYLLAHNVARAASGMSKLKWDRGLARFASKWAKVRKSDCERTHSDGDHGENIMWYKRSDTWSPKRVVETWMDERQHYDHKTNTCKSGEMCGHYTQIVWRSTTAVGCARTKCDNDRGFLVICEYSPAGNYEGVSPFA